MGAHQVGAVEDRPGMIIMRASLAESVNRRSIAAAFSDGEDIELVFSKRFRNEGVSIPLFHSRKPVDWMSDWCS